MNLSQRSTEIELMDSPDVSPVVLKNTLKDINRANSILGGNSITKNAVSQLLRKHPKKTYTIVDMGCGDGAMLRLIAKWGRKKGYDLKCVGIDLSENAITLAKSESLDFPEIRYLKQDILTLHPDDLSCDILLCTLTMHHFNNEEIPVFLKKFTVLANIGVVINDLQRSRFAYYLFKIFSAIFIQTSMAKHDGLISIKSGFVKSELVQFSKALKEVKHDIQWKWAFRYVWVMKPDRLK